MHNESPIAQGRAEPCSAAPRTDHAPGRAEPCSAAPRTDHAPGRAEPCSADHPTAQPAFSPTHTTALQQHRARRTALCMGAIALAVYAGFILSGVIGR